MHFLWIHISLTKRLVEVPDGLINSGVLDSEGFQNLESTDPTFNWVYLRWWVSFFKLTAIDLWWSSQISQRSFELQMRMMDHRVMIFSCILLVLQNMCTPREKEESSPIILVTTVYKEEEFFYSLKGTQKLYSSDQKCSWCHLRSLAIRFELCQFSPLARLTMTEPLQFICK